ncbi:serine hydrolase domain-containing protein [Tsukamurella tyrosinosolvens]|uniref:serine hydrolase domain-containing protein n=1 Tax=Tsukamurella tyrosinosolvens TaxID=57704 RepID=UPI001374BB5C|nr:serine hydrolase domain-containing protein [Tsukamurella tyrosinosolvens]
MTGLIVALLWGIAGGPAGADSGAVARAADLLEAAGVPGYAMRVVGPSGVEQEQVEGTDGGGRPITSTTPFVWGSVSKSVAARSALALAGRGLLNLDSPVVRAIPSAVPWVGGDVTVRDLIRHTSGLRHDVTLTDLARPGPARDTVLATAPPARESRGVFGYSSLNYLLLQAVIEAVTAAPYGATVAGDVGAPAGARILTDSESFAAEVPPGHVPFLTRPRRTDPVFDGAGLGYGYLAGSLDALSRYAQWLARDASWQSFPAVPTGRVADYGPGLYREAIAGRTVWWHTGAVPGYFAYIAVLPESGRTLVLLANRYGELDSERLAEIARYAMRGVAGDAGDPPYAAPWSSLVLVCAAAGVGLGGLAVGWTAMRLVRRRSAPARRYRVMTAAAGASICGLVGAASWFGPAALGYPRPVLARWAPDIAVLLLVLAVEAAALAVLMLASNWRRVAPAF